MCGIDGEWARLYFFSWTSSIFTSIPPTPLRWGWANFLARKLRSLADAVVVNSFASSPRAEFGDCTTMSSICAQRPLIKIRSYAQRPRPSGRLLFRPMLPSAVGYLERGNQLPFRSLKILQAQARSVQSSPPANRRWMYSAMVTRNPNPDPFGAHQRPAITTSVKRAAMRKTPMRGHTISIGRAMS